MIYVDWIIKQNKYNRTKININWMNKLINIKQTNKQLNI